MSLDADKQNTLDAVYAEQMQLLARRIGNTDLRAIAACAQLQEALANRCDHYRHGGKRGDVDAAVAEVVRTSFALMPDQSPVWDHLAVSAQPCARDDAS